MSWLVAFGQRDLRTPVRSGQACGGPRGYQAHIMLSINCAGLRPAATNGRPRGRYRRPLQCQGVGMAAQVALSAP
jgi:hypothetical protein